MDKGALHAKLAHIEAETDKVTWGRVSLTVKGGEQECLVGITIFTFFSAFLFLFSQDVYFVFFLPVNTLISIFLVIPPSSTNEL